MTATPSLRSTRSKRPSPTSSAAPSATPSWFCASARTRTSRRSRAATSTASSASAISMTSSNWSRARCARAAPSLIGGGLLGLEAARGMALRKIETVVVEHESHLMARQLDEAGGQLLEKQITRWDCRSAPAARSRRSKDRTGSNSVVLSNGETHRLRHRHHLHRHPLQYRAGARRRDRGRPRHHRQQPDADLAAGHLCRRRMRRA